MFDYDRGVKQDVAIIGGGVIGVACAVELARRGAQVTVLEQDRVGHGCSFGNAGWLTPSQAVPLANPAMLLKSFKWMLDPDSPLYIQPRLDPGVSPLADRVPARVAQGEVRTRRGGAGRVVPRQRRPVGGRRERSPEPFGFERHGLLAVYENAASLEAATRPSISSASPACAPSDGRPTRSATRSPPSSAARSAAISTRTTRIASRTGA